MTRHVEVLPGDAERFWSRVQKTDGCWLWKGATSGPSRYGAFYLSAERGTVRAHRFALMISGVTLTRGTVACHHCDTPLCVRPDHLFAATTAENQRDMAVKGRARNQNKGKTVCKFGHALTPENTMRRPDGRRRCLICHQRQSREGYHRTGKTRRRCRAEKAHSAPRIDQTSAGIAESCIESVVRKPRA